MFITKLRKIRSSALHWNTVSSPSTKVIQDVNAVKQSIATLDTKIQALHDVITQLASVKHRVSASCDMPNQIQVIQPPTYSLVVSADVMPCLKPFAINK